MFKRFISILFVTLFVFAANFANAEERIKMTLDGGVYTIPCEVNGLRMKFIFDTGASMVSISMTEARFMYKNGYIDDDDFTGTAKTRIANGDIEENMKLTLREVKVGSKTIHNVEALVSNSANAPLLLGQSVLRQLGTWSIDGDCFVIKDGSNYDDEEEDEAYPDEADRLYKLALQYLNSGDKKNAIECFNEAAQIYYDLNDFENYYNIAKKSANLGSSEGQNNLGFCYNEGLYVSQDYKQAVYWYKKAAEQGYDLAQYNMALHYNSGEGVTKNIRQAVYWYKKAAVQGYDLAQFNLGLCYYNGEGVAKNYEQAVYWYKKAAEQGYARAQYNLGVCYDNGDGVAQSYQQAGYWFKQAAEQGHAMAQYNLGVCYDNGDGVPQSKKEAKYWFRKAAAQGDRDAQIMLEKLQ